MQDMAFSMHRHWLTLRSLVWQSKHAYKVSWSEPFVIHKWSGPDALDTTAHFKSQIVVCSSMQMYA